MELTIWALTMAFLWSSLFCILFFCFRRNTKMIASFGILPALILFGGFLLRAFLPVDFPGFTQVISETDEWYLKIDSFLLRWQTPVLGIAPIYLFLGIWAAGSVFLIVRFLVRYGRSAFQLAQMLEEDEGPLYQIAVEKAAAYHVKRLRIVRYAGLKSPAITGLLRPTILFPDFQYTEKEIACVLDHELTHWRKRHQWIKLLVKLTCYLMWWNPFVYLLDRNLNQSLEIRCDLSVTKDWAIPERKAYLETMIRTLQCACEQKKQNPMSLASDFFTSTRQKLRQRFDLVLEYRENKRRNRVVAAVTTGLFAALLVLSFAFVVQPAYEPAASDIAPNSNTEQITPDNTYILRDSDGKYYIIVHGKKTQQISEQIVDGLVQGGFEIKS